MLLGSVVACPGLTGNPFSDTQLALVNLNISYGYLEDQLRDYRDV